MRGFSPRQPRLLFDMRIDFPKDSYIKSVTVNDNDLDIDFQPRKKVALLFISLNDRYWPYLAQVLKDARKNFLPHHHVDYFVWTDYGHDQRKKIVDALDGLEADVPKNRDLILQTFTNVVRLHHYFEGEQVRSIMDTLSKNGLTYKTEGPKAWVESTRQLTDLDYQLFNKMSRDILVKSWEVMTKELEGTTITEIEPVEWPAPTLMRYHLFLDKKEDLKDYDYIYYMDADMRVVDKISDEIMGPGLTAAPHPGYAVKPILIPPYEPNPESEAYIPRLGQLKEENGKKRLHPFYAAGGFQGGAAGEFIKAMEVMKKKIDKDFNKNYVAIWNDESHWNRFLFDYQQQKGHITFLDPSYVYPDSLIKELYEPHIWGRAYSPKIITLTKPFTLSAQAAEEIKEMTKPV